MTVSINKKTLTSIGDFGVVINVKKKYKYKKLILFNHHKIFTMLKKDLMENLCNI